MNIRKVKTISLMIVISLLSAKKLWADEICWRCLEQTMQPYCQALKRAGLLHSKIELQDFSEVGGKSSMASCEHVLAHWVIDQKIPEYYRDIAEHISWSEKEKIENFCYDLQEISLMPKEKQQDCVAFYEKNNLP